MLGKCSSTSQSEDISCFTCPCLTSSTSQECKMAAFWKLLQRSAISASLETHGRPGGWDTVGVMQEALL